MNWNKGIRQTHRWLSIAFTLTLIISFVAIAQEQPVEWIFYLPLPPLFLLLFSGLYLFVLPYTGRGRSKQQID